MNPNNSRPMSYDSLKTMLQYAKPSLRFELSRRIPSIRLMEKAVPLRIHKLFIGSHGVEVNDTKYEARTIRHFPPDLKMFSDEVCSDEGDWDLDEWGFDDYSSETVFTPGDLVMQVEGQEPRQRIQNEEKKKELENELKFVEWMIAKKSGETVEPTWTGEAVNTFFKNFCESTSLIRLSYAAEKHKIDLAPYYCFENNVPLPFTKMVQVVIPSENGTLCWNYSGNLKYYEVRKQLVTWLLGNRKHVINVNHLIVTNGIIARLPENLRISIKTLQTETFSSIRIPVDTNTMLNKLEAIIHNHDRPLEVFETEKTNENFDHPMATNAKKLVFNQRWFDFPDADRLIRISNQKMHMGCSLQRPGYFEQEAVIQLIIDWKEHPREIGKCFSFEGNKTAVIRFMQNIQAIFEGITTERSIKITVNNFSQISISYESQSFLKWYRDLRLMTIEVVAA